MKRKLAITVAAIAATCAVGLTASPALAGTTRPYYMDELRLGNSIESQGFWYSGRHLPVDSAFCSGLRRFGVRSSLYGLDKFWHFKCDVQGANGHFYSVAVKTTTSGRRWYWREVSASMDF